VNYEDFLREKYGKSTLSVEELSEELSGGGKGVSVRMIQDRARECSSEIPKFIRVGGRVVFPIKEVAKWLEQATVKVA
jgi:predicted DNA-binding transcriptional regulator AlpA